MRAGSSGVSVEGEGLATAVVVEGPFWLEGVVVKEVLFLATASALRGFVWLGSRATLLGRRARLLVAAALAAWRLGFGMEVAEAPWSGRGGAVSEKSE